ncbi:hypothetical protein [Haliscomenobacter hydrossis]|uniref:hypothetical protein n=1 Tax=Haliscomenobacter hydrossis TaxID=2350 RepID=UPI0005C5C9C4|nr:hypothetical protein [Haliscomenobacter hydrossis]
MSSCRRGEKNKQRSCAKALSTAPISPTSTGKGNARNNIIYYLVLLLLLVACQPVAKPERAFYHWQTRLALSQAEQQRLHNLGVTRLYAKFFDIDWDERRGQIVPLASIQMDTAGLHDLELVPVVFITNRTWAHVESEAQLQQLVQRTLDKIKNLGTPLDPRRISEVQIDCDWNQSTRRVYFAFLEALGQKLASQGRKLSATIRLHQCKYPQRTGVPPVARGMLMLYNVGQLEDWAEDNSIFSQKAVAAYAPLPRFPLPLDVVLPAFSWGVLFREGEMIRLLNDLRAETLRGDARFEEIAPRRFRVQKSTYLNGHYLYQGDLLRIETCGGAELAAAAQFARRELPRAEQRWVAIYHLHSGLMKALSEDQLEEVFGVF